MKFISQWSRPPLRKLTRSRTGADGLSGGSSSGTGTRTAGAADGMGSLAGTSDESSAAAATGGALLRRRMNCCRTGKRPPTWRSLRRPRKRKAGSRPKVEIAPGISAGSRAFRLHIREKKEESEPPAREPRPILGKILVVGIAAACIALAAAAPKPPNFADRLPECSKSGSELAEPTACPGSAGGAAA